MLRASPARWRCPPPQTEQVRDSTSHRNRREVTHQPGARQQERLSRKERGICSICSMKGGLLISLLKIGDLGGCLSQIQYR